MYVCYYSCTIELKICEYKKGVPVSTKTLLNILKNNHYSWIAKIKKKDTVNLGVAELKESRNLHQTDLQMSLKFSGCLKTVGYCV